MQFCQFRPKFLTSVIILLPTFATATSINCKDVRVKGKSFNLDPLKGPHSVGWDDVLEDSIRNFTFTIDICNPLEKIRGIEECPAGSNVCGIERVTNEHENGSFLNAIPIAGNYLHDGASLDPKWTRLKESSSHDDREKEGLRLEMHGKKYHHFNHMAVVEFLCDADKKKEERRQGLPNLRLRQEKDDDNAVPHFNQEEDDGNGGRLKFQSYEEKDHMKRLSLEWTTRTACEDAVDDKPEKGSTSGHWGFFTWLIIILFLAIAAYLIFGSWLNYNRYSARGWDLVPHSETIRDLPYLLRDWARRVVNTIQGGGSRGGYSAV